MNRSTRGLAATGLLVALAQAVLMSGATMLPAGEGCPKEYFGEISGVHWFDVWKVRGNCFGGYIEGVPHSQAEIPCLSGTCSGPFIVWSTKRTIDKEGATPAPVQQDLYELSDPKTRFDISALQLRRLQITYDGVARVRDPQGTARYFKIFTLIRRDDPNDPNDRPLRRIGVEVLNRNSFPAWTAEVTPAGMLPPEPTMNNEPEPPAERPYSRYINVTYDDGEVVRYYVTVSTGESGSAPDIRP